MPSWIVMPPWSVSRIRQSVTAMRSSGRPGRDRLHEDAAVHVFERAVRHREIAAAAPDADGGGKYLFLEGELVAPRQLGEIPGHVGEAEGEAGDDDVVAVLEVDEGGEAAGLEGDGVGIEIVRQDHVQAPAVAPRRSNQNSPSGSSR
jgi:hypothetical protein